MKRTLFGLAILVLVGLPVAYLVSNPQMIAGLQKINTPAASTPAAAGELPPTLAPIRSDGEVVSACKLAPVRTVELSFTTAGVVGEVLVREGDIVEAGQVVARLNGIKQLEAEVASAEYELLTARQDAQKMLDNAFYNTTKAYKELADAPVAVKNAEDRLEDLRDNDDSEDEEIAQAEADLALARAKQEEAQRHYDLLKNGPDPEEIRRSEARTKQAEAQLAAAQEALENHELRVPFTGTVAQLYLEAGEVAASGRTALVLADFSHWMVKTTNLTELKIVEVEAGDPAVVTFDSLPDQKYPGIVQSIGAVGENIGGDIVYQVIIWIDIDDPRLRWNMSCSVQIQDRP